MQHSAHLSLEKKHDGTWAMKSIHQYNLNALFLIFIKVDPVLFIHLEVDDIVRDAGKPI